MSNGKQLRRKLTVVPQSERTREQLEKEVAEEKATRQQLYSEKVNALLKEGNCGLITVAQFGETAVSIDKVLAVPVQIIVIAN